MDISFFSISILIATFVIEIKGSSLRVVGGYEAPNNYGRFQTSLQNLTGYHVCGGAVISENCIVTAAHCVQGALPEYIKVLVGTSNLDEGGQQYNVTTIKIHSDFDFSQRTNDIAIIRVDGKFNSEYVDILEIDKTELKEGDPLVLTGFGAVQANGESSHKLHALDLTVFSQETCKYAMRYTREVFDHMFCTFSRLGEGTCHGDSGGPLIKNNKLVGLVSWGIPCAVGFPDVHTRISSYFTWIQEEISN